MANLGAKVERVSRKDVVEARTGADFSASKNTVKTSKKSSEQNLPYVLKLKEKDIVNFFKKYGYIGHEIISDESGAAFVQVNCENFDVIFNDYDVAVNCLPEYSSTLSNFDFEAFSKYCKTIDVPIEQAIADTRKKGKQTFSEAAAQEEGFSFYERYFSKAKTLTKEREIELRKEQERASISR
jgi:hypothetical protein